jgi:hypothetical protein
MASPLKIETLINRVAFAIRGDYATGETILREQIQWALSDAQNEMWRNFAHSDFVAEGTFTTVADQQDYDLPTDFSKMIEPSLKFTADRKETLHFATQQDWDGVEGDDADESGRPELYTLRGKAMFDGSTWTGAKILRLFPTPDDAYAMRFSYIARPKPIADIPESALVDERWADEFVDLLVNGAAVKFPQFLGQDQLAVFEARYREGLRQLRNASHAIIGESYEKHSGLPGRSSVFGPRTSDTGWAAAE